MSHIPVLLHEALDALCIRSDGIYLDCTFGRGGHSRAILASLDEGGRLIGFDRDPSAVAAAGILLRKIRGFEIVRIRRSPSLSPRLILLLLLACTAY